MRLLLLGRRHCRPYNARICPIIIQYREGESGGGGVSGSAVWNNKFRGWGAFCKIVPRQINPLGSRLEWRGEEMAVITLVETTRWAVRYCPYRARRCARARRSDFSGI